VKKLWFGVALVLLIVIIAIFAPYIAMNDPNDMSLPDRYMPPTLQHPFGLDQNGSDVFSQVVYGARVSLLVAISVVTIGAILGLIIGSLAGFNGGWVDLILMRILDMMYAFPGFLLALAMVAVLGPSVRNLIFAMCVTSWTGFARLVRGEILHLKTRDYVVSARALGAGPTRVLVFHIWPNLLALVLVQASFALAGTIITESGLSFLGLGAPPTVPTWGSLLNAGRRVIIEAPHVSLFPGLAILTLVLGFNLCGDGLRLWLSPRKN
jgi:peptide/nickel transport system permease protein